MFNSPLLFVVLMFEGDGVRSEDRDFIPWPPLGRQQHKKLQVASAFNFFFTISLCFQTFSETRESREEQELCSKRGLDQIRSQ